MHVFNYCRLALVVLLLLLFLLLLLLVVVNAFLAGTIKYDNCTSSNNRMMATLEKNSAGSIAANSWHVAVMHVCTSSGADVGAYHSHRASVALGIEPAAWLR
jgi:hypothetical protein